ncbi:MAG: tryptophan synthase subunit alpha [Deltaproteobacteria bacterium]
MNRIDLLFRRLQKADEAALIPFITAGDPDMATTEALLFELEKAGADLIELGFPFSDPLADGPTIQAANQRSLRRGTTLEDVLDLVARFRPHSQIPIVIMGYYNPILQFGLARFAERAASSGIDGTIIPDLPLEEAGPWMREAAARGIANILLAAPTTPDARLGRIASRTRGFLYYVSVTGITGGRTELPPDLLEGIRRAKGKSKRPVCVGFGISTPAQVSLLAPAADGIIVGSALIRVMERHIRADDTGYRADPGLVEEAGAFVRSLKEATRRGL